MTSPHADSLLREAVALAERWQNEANRLLTLRERNYQRQMMRLIRNPLDKVILTQMIDQSFRTDDHARVADQVHHVLKKHGVPGFFSLPEQGLMQLFMTAGRHAPGISIPKMIEKIRADSARSVIPGEKDKLYPHLRKRKAEGVRMNLNHLGEAVLGEAEAATRLEQYIRDMQDPEIEYISVKISTIFSQISSLALEYTLSVLVERLSRLYRTAQSNFHQRADGSKVPKFVNLDMEEYRDLEITLEAFRRTLDQPEFQHYSAGIVLQAYLPDSLDEQIALTEWAKRRVAAGGAPIKVRIVKGANMEMELVEAALHDWPLAPYDNKLEVDANYKRMVEFGMTPDNAKAVHLGIASHNLFEQAYAYLLAQSRGVAEFVSLEMLEGMANHVWRAMRKVSDETVLLYAPVASKDEFINAIGYLVRRLDENTAEENFLRYSFNLRADSPEWAFLRDRFTASYHYKEKARRRPNRTQDRTAETFLANTGTLNDPLFRNEPDTDWALCTNRRWAEAVRDQWMNRPPDDIPVVVAGREIFEGLRTVECFDPNRMPEKIPVARYAVASPGDIDTMVATAKADPDGWRTKTARDRHEILSRVALELRRSRGDLIGRAAANTGKVFAESDPEVSEAVDFAEFYPWSVRRFDAMPNLSVTGKGVGLVITPWNFPVAIPTGGITAALAAGNTVIFKPASAAVPTAWELCQCFWRAGVSRNTLQFVPCSGSEVGDRLTGNPGVDFIIFTGGTETGMNILKQRPGILLAAETGGKNATIVTAMADRDLAIKHILHSAFSNCGQKCSATSLAVLDKEIFADENFRRQLVDAAKSYTTGSAWQFRNRMATLIAPPKGDLLNALTRLEPGEEWALKPEQVGDNPYMWTPGIKWNVVPGSYTHITEFFGPVLAVMKADHLEHAIELVNQTGYGLTSGLQSLDDREQAIWREKIEAGNLYINRVTTGAIVLRQPFGGMKKSALGAGIKAGSPNYVTQFMTITETGLPETGPIEKDYRLLRLVQEWEGKVHWGQLAEWKDDLEKTVRAVKSCLFHAEREFLRENDYFRLRGEDNVLRYRPVGTVLVRVHEKDSLFEVLARTAAASIAGCQVIVGLPKNLSNTVTAFLYGEEGRKFLGPISLVRHTEEDLAETLPELDRIRYAAPDRVPAAVFAAAAQTGFYIARSPVFMEGRLEMLHYLREQSISHSYHRYGNLGERGLAK